MTKRKTSVRNVESDEDSPSESTFEEAPKTVSMAAMGESDEGIDYTSEQLSDKCEELSSDCDQLTDRESSWNESEYDGESPSQVDDSKGSDQSPSDEREYHHTFFGYEYGCSSSEESGKYSQDKKSERYNLRGIEEAASNTHSVIRKYGCSRFSPPDPKELNGTRQWEIDEDSAWSDPSAAMKEIIGVRDQLIRAWKLSLDEEVEGKKLGRQHEAKREWWQSIVLGDSNGKKMDNMIKIARLQDRDGVYDKAANQEKESDQFNEIFMEWTMNAFANELDVLRKGQLESFHNISKSRGKKNSTSPFDLDPDQHSFIMSAAKNSEERLTSKIISKEMNEKKAEVGAEVDVEVLADMLQSNSHFLMEKEKSMLLRSKQRKEKYLGAGQMERKQMRGLRMTPRERQRQKLGFVFD